MFLLSLAGIAIMLRDKSLGLRGPAVLTMTISAVVIGFYIARPLVDRNYGGVTCGPRWLFWLIPLWLLCLLPAADAIAPSRLCRGMALAALAVGVLSATYGSFNPWSHPWIFDYWSYLEWIAY